MEKNRIILFDLDGTLIDSTEAILESFDYAFGSFGMECPDHELIKKEIGHPLDMMFSELGIEEGRVWDFVAKYKENYQKISRAKTVLLPNAKEAVLRAYEIAELGVVTTKTGKYSIELLEHLGLIQYFRTVIGRENVEHPKPHPEPVHRALEYFPQEIADIWMIGDTCMDMEAAKAAGINAVAVICGYAAHDEIAGCATIITADALEAVEHIKKK